MEKQSIVVNIFGRQFPARVDSEEAAVIQEAAQSINGKIKAFKAQYKTQDDLDIAIMCCLDIMTEHLKDKANTARQTDTALESLQELEQRLDTSIQLSES
ncbi:MAG: cell division protein ZapA [Bacteroidota bacterium]